MVALEAMERGRAVIAASVGGLPEIVGDARRARPVGRGRAAARRDRRAGARPAADRGAGRRRPQAGARRVLGGALHRPDRGPLPEGARVKLATVSCHVERPLDDRTLGRVLGVPGPPAGRLRDRGADAPARRRTRARRSGSPARGSPPRAGRSATTRTGAGANQARPVGRRPGRARPAERRPGCASAGSSRSSSAAAAGTWTRASPPRSPSSGYADCTATAFRPDYLAADAPRLELAEPAWLRVGDAAPARAAGDALARNGCSRAAVGAPARVRPRLLPRHRPARRAPPARARRPRWPLLGRRRAPTTARTPHGRGRSRTSPRRCRCGTSNMNRPVATKEAPPRRPRAATARPGGHPAQPPVPARPQRRSAASRSGWAASSALLALDLRRGRPRRSTAALALREVYYGHYADPLGRPLDDAEGEVASRSSRSSRCSSSGRRGSTRSASGAPASGGSSRRSSSSRCSCSRSGSAPGTTSPPSG